MERSSGKDSFGSLLSLNKETKEEDPGVRVVMEHFSVEMQNI